MGVSEELIVKPPGWGDLDLLDIHCAICKDILENPRMVPGCEHTYCKQCGKTAMKNPPHNCPTCRTPQESAKSLVRPPRVLRNILDKLTVKCSFSPEGCKDSAMPFDKIRKHEKGCKFNPANAPKLCDKGCGLLVAKESQASHVCVTALVQEVDRLREVVSDVFSFKPVAGVDLKVVKQCRVTDVACLPLNGSRFSSPFLALGHYWKFQCQRLKLDGEKWFALFLVCDGPITVDGDAPPLTWTLKLDRSLQLGLKVFPGTESGAEKWRTLNGGRVYCHASLVEANKTSHAWGFNKFCKWDDLIGPNFMAPDGSITLEAVFPVNC